MATKNRTTTRARKASPRKAAARPARKTPSTGARAAEAFRERWEAGLQALTAAEAAVEKQVRLLIKKNRISAKDASAVLDQLGTRFARERKKLVKQLGSRVKDVRGRLKKEGRAVGRRVDEAVSGTLAALNIPSRREVAELTAKVETLSKKIDAFRRS